MTDIRWKQRLSNFKKSLAHLADAVEIEEPSILQQAGTIQFFEMGFELAWKTLKDYLEEQGFTDVKSPKATIKKAFEVSLIEDGHMWLEALENRNLAAHTYDDETAQEIYDLICHSYFPLLEALKNRLEKLSDES
jgi:nucleotidyltransferase substrate binding protein (TIGR01987 family)